MKRVVREYFEENRLERDLSGEVLLRVKESRIKNLRRLSLFLLMVNLLTLLLLLPRSFSGNEYRTMSAGLEVRLKRDATLGELEDFLKEQGLSISGPTSNGTFFLRKAEGELKSLSENPSLFEVVDR